MPGPILLSVAERVVMVYGRIIIVIRPKQPTTASDTLCLLVVDERTIRIRLKLDQRSAMLYLWRVVFAHDA
jgi:hypothetical protein